MANQSVRVAAAARAAAKRAEKARRPGRPGTISSRTLSVLEADAKAKAQPDADTGSESRTAPAEKPPRHRSGLLSAILAVLVVAGLAATAILGFLHREAGRTDQARAGALAAARKAAPVVLSYDYRHLDRDFAAARGHLTGSFRDEYGKTTKTVVAPTAKKYRGVVKATVAKPPGAGAPAAVSVVSASPDKAVILLFMNQVTNSTQVSGPRVDLNRVRMTLVPTSQGWKVSAVDAL
ncbi:hypothetical protein ACFT7S_16805 [Streptomyces sp. NPDC057136]|uniref:hypothetical protein n=1 Tax=Streptomyces sp. NPDC057136 TaxID=3346029 RepID=UPI00362AB67E